MSRRNFSRATTLLFRSMSSFSESLSMSIIHGLKALAGLAECAMTSGRVDPGGGSRAAVDRGLPRRRSSIHADRRTFCWRTARRLWCCLTFELRRPARRGALGPRRTMEPATALCGPGAPRLAGSPLERGVRPYADASLAPGRVS
jgi:hypothetical protein